MYRARLDYGLDTIDMSVGTMRKLTTYALVAFPLGAVIAETSDLVAPFVLLIGFLLMFSAIFTGAALAATRAYRMVEGRKGFSGEYERALRFEAMAKAYTILTRLIVATLAYGFVATELDLWLPREPSDWNLLILGVGNLFMILPAATLVWSGKLDDDDEGAEAK